MEKYFRERFEAQKRLLKKLATTLEVNEILESIREEIRMLLPSTMEVCVLLLDNDALDPFFNLRIVRHARSPPYH